MDKHVCDEQCVCPEDGLPMYYHAGSDRHACQLPECVNARGLDSEIDPLGWVLEQRRLRDFWTRQ